MAKKAKCLYKPGSNFFSFPRCLLTNPDYFNMSFSAQSLLHAMCGLYNGFNNGNISIAFSDMKKIGWKSAGTLHNAKMELIENNWIYVTRQGGKGKYYACSLYAISFIPLDAIRKDLDVSYKAGYEARAFKKD